MKINDLLPSSEKTFFSKQTSKEQMTSDDGLTLIHIVMHFELLDAHLLEETYQNSREL